MINVSKRNIKESVIRGGMLLGTVNIKYPHFDCVDGEKCNGLCEKMNMFYEGVSTMIKDFAHKKLSQRHAFTEDRVLPCVGMSYMVSLNCESLINVVLDITLYAGDRTKKKRFSQCWSIKRGDIVPAKDFFKGAKSNKKRILSLVIETANDNAKSGVGKYFKDFAKRIAHVFCLENFFFVPEGLCFFADAGKVAPINVGSVGFVVGKNKIIDLLSDEMADCLDEKESEILP